jgi:FMN-dependent NADH-azoreductase
VLATIGLHDVRFITLEGVARGTEAADLALAKADAAITAALNKIG